MLQIFLGIVQHFLIISERPLYIEDLVEGSASLVSNLKISILKI